MNSSKRKFEPQIISKVLDEIINSKALNKGLINAKVRQLWPSLMGENIDRYTEKIIVRNKTLIISLSSAPLREELTYGKEKIVKMINKELGRKLIDYFSLKNFSIREMESDFNNRVFVTIRSMYCIFSNGCSKKFSDCSFCCLLRTSGANKCSKIINCIIFF